MILIRGIAGPDRSGAGLKAAAARRLGVAPERVTALKIVRRSLDARKKDNIHYLFSVAAAVTGDEAKLIARAHDRDILAYVPETYAFPQPAPGCLPAQRPVVVGFGPAGMFAALSLARAGLCPIVLERGRDVDRRTADVEAFRAGGALQENSNVQFGEGGAGTFSDGKLNTGTHDRRICAVLQEFAVHGAPESVTYDAKPHIGTDVLTGVVKAFRQEILSLGGEVRFENRLIGLEIASGKLTGARVLTPAGEEALPCSRLILAIGHSARDTFRMLQQLPVPMERKTFSMGVRIEHLRRDIDRAQYGPAADSPASGRELPAADYSLSVHLPDGNSAYTFCMCPGGSVFAAASETGGVVTNGMSTSGRDGVNSNAALLVNVRAEDLPGDDLLAGMELQLQVEQQAFRTGGANYFAPAQLVGDFLQDRPSTGPGRVVPSYRPGVTWCDLRQVLPEPIPATLKQALPLLGRKLRGFDDPEAVLTAPETRSSSPVRILRDERFQSALSGLFPCGEGAGYAGGITSAAVDGLRCAEALIQSLAEN